MRLEIENLVKTYGENKAIAIDHLLIPDCHTLAVLGGSGSGKSTLVRLLGGLTFPDKGKVVIDGHEIIYSKKELLKYRKRVGVVFQSFNLFPHLTALENIMLPLRHVQGLSQEEAMNRSMNLLKRFELDKHAHKRPYELSGGQTQRVALIRAVATQPKLLLLDEPTSALDPLMTSEVLELILELKKEKCDLVLMTHHCHFAKMAADWVIFMSEGNVVESGNSKEIFEHPKSIKLKLFLDKVMAF